MSLCKGEGLNVEDCFRGLATTFPACCEAWEEGVGGPSDTGLTCWTSGTGRSDCTELSTTGLSDPSLSSVPGSTGLTINLYFC